MIEKMQLAAVTGARALLTIGLAALCMSQPLRAEAKFKRIPMQFIAALADPKATSGTGAETWGLWRQDPGPRGVRLADYERLKATRGVTPAGWTFDASDWWLEEHGLIMEQPEFPLAPGQYMVTGDREVTAVLTVSPKDKDGVQRWALDKGATLYDVTHLPCRSARYAPVKGAAKDATQCSPALAQAKDFPVTPGAAMPAVPSCAKQDYAVLFVIAVGVEN
jgi:hypothetical protein